MYKRLLRSVLAAAFAAVVAYGVLGGADTGWGITPEATTADTGWGSAPGDTGWGSTPATTADTGWGSSPAHADA